MIKGTVHSLEEPKDANGDYRFCKVVIDNDPGVVTQPLNIPWNWRGCFGNIQVGDRVFCAIDDNLEGCILQRIDGDWDYKIKNKTDVFLDKNINIGGNVDIKGNETVAGDETVGGNSTITGIVQAADARTQAVASVNAHTHTSADPGKPTSTPNG